jgi:hypothetical protein
MAAFCHCSPFGTARYIRPQGLALEIPGLRPRDGPIILHTTDGLENLQGLLVQGSELYRAVKINNAAGSRISES